MNLLIFGPPGIGKSAVILELQSIAFIEGKSTIGFDVERVWNDKPMKGRIRELMHVWPQVQELMGLPDLVIGAAGLDPSIMYPGFRKVLLSLSQEQYLTRRNARNIIHPEYEKQGEHEMSQWIALTKWYRIVSAEGTPLQVVRRLEHLL